MESHIDQAIAAIEKSGGAGDPLAIATARGIVRAYARHYSDDDFVVKAVEDEFVLPLLNPTTGQEHREWHLGGKRDAIIEDKQGIYIMEHKTTSSDIGPQSWYWRGLTIDNQVCLYLIATFSEQPRGVLYDAIKKPGIKPRKLTKAEAKTLDEDRTYFGRETPDDFASAGLYGTKETPSLYECRLQAEYESDGHRFFGRRVIPRLDDKLVEHLAHFCLIADDMDRCRGDERNYYCNPKSCNAYNSRCEYLDLCTGHDHPESETWATRNRGFSDDKPELTMTASSIDCFLQCRRKHHYRYGLRIEKLRKQESPALYFGKLVHEGLASLLLSKGAING